MDCLKCSLAMSIREMIFVAAADDGSDDDELFEPFEPPRSDIDWFGEI